MRTRDISVVVVMLLFLLLLPSSSESKMLRSAYRFWQSHKRFRYFPHHTKQQKQAQKPNRNTFCAQKRSSTRERIESLRSYFALSVVQNTKERCESAFFNTHEYTLGKNEHPNSLYKCSLNARIYRLWREKKEKIAHHLVYICGMSLL